MHPLSVDKGPVIDGFHRGGLVFDELKKLVESHALEDGHDVGRNGAQDQLPSRCAQQAVQDDQAADRHR